MNLDNVAAELAAALETIPKLKVLSYIPGKVSPPCAFVALGQGRYTDDFGGGQTVEWEIPVIVSKANVQGAQELLRAFAAPDATQSPYSIPAAVEADPGLNGEIGSVDVKTWDAPERVDIGGIEYVQIVFHVETVD